MGSQAIASARLQLGELLEDARFWKRETGELVREIGRVLARAARAVWGARAAGLHTLAILLGWAGVTAGVAPVLARVGLAAWPLSGGLLLLSLAGWRHLRMVATAGLLALHQLDQKQKRGGA